MWEEQFLRVLFSLLRPWENYFRLLEHEFLLSKLLFPNLVQNLQLQLLDKHLFSDVFHVHYRLHLVESLISDIVWALRIFFEHPGVIVLQFVYVNFWQGRLTALFNIWVFLLKISLEPMSEELFRFCKISSRLL